MKLLQAACLSLGLALSIADFSVAGDVSGKTWKIAPRDFKLGYALAITEAYFLLPPHDAPANDPALLISTCIEKRGISPGQLIAMMDTYLAANPGQEQNNLFNIAFEALFKACAP